jgi:hypothetical protein
VLSEPKRKSCAKEKVLSSDQKKTLAHKRQSANSNLNANQALMMAGAMNESL